MILPILALSLKIGLAILAPLLLHIIFRVILSISIKYLAWLIQFWWPFIHQVYIGLPQS